MIIKYVQGNGILYSREFYPEPDWLLELKLDYHDLHR